MIQQRERELKFDIEPDWAVPDLHDHVPRGGRIETTTEQLDAEYHDTADLLLRRLKITLRRRTGGHDAGWHLKLPAGEARTEVQSASRRMTLPREIGARLRGVVGERRLEPVARLSTTRQLLRLRDADDAVVLEVALDDVSGHSYAADSEPLHWREVEVELGPAGDEDRLAAVADDLMAAGARPSRSASKLSRVTGAPPAAATIGPLADLVADYVRTQCAAVLLGDIVLRGDLDEHVVHDTRVAVRRLRSTLRMYAVVLRDQPGMDEELRWYAGLLGELRDSDVLDRHLRREVGELRPDDRVGDIDAALDEALAAHRTGAIRHWRRGSRTPRAAQVLERVADWLVEVPLAADASDLTLGDGKAVVKGARKKARRRLAVAGSDPDRLHRARKAAKRLRYAADLLAPAWPKATKIAKRAKHRQSILGDHQDDVVAAAFLRAQGTRRGDARGHNGFTWGLLTARAEQRAREARRTARDLEL